MSTMPIPRLPNPLTPKTIEGLMKARPYWDLSHPRSPLYHRLVQRGFEIMYPNTRYDEFGRMIDLKPLKPEYIAHLVVKENREMEALESAIEGESGGTVHVRAHTRVVDGKQVEVSAYERAAPEGSGDEMGSNPESRPTPGSPDFQNMPYYPERDREKPAPLGRAPKEDWRSMARPLADKDSADDARDRPATENAGDKTDAGGTQAGTDDDRPKPANPLPDLPRIEIRKDGEGDGRFGVRRRDQYGNIYDHEGVDIKAPPGTPVTSPVDGTIDRITDAYKSGPLVGQFQAITIEGDDKQEYKFLYVTPKDSDGEILVKNKDRVSAGDPIGTVQDRAAYDRTGKMDNHIHIEIRDASKNIVDPTPHVKDWQK